MKQFKTPIKLATLLLVATMLITQSSIICVAAAGTIYESENNNAPGNADVTYDDYNNYGSLPAGDTEDWWKISFTSEGMANFYLGSVPGGCDYDIQLYDYTGTKLMIESLKGSNADELLKCHVRSGKTYYIRVFRNSNATTVSSSNYLLRVKNYDLLGVNIFTTTVDIDTTLDAEMTEPIFENMGFLADEKPLETANSIFYKIPSLNIWINSNHGAPGKTCAYKYSSGEYKHSYIYGNYTEELTTSDKALSSLSYGALDNNVLAIYACCYNGVTETEYGFGNLVDITLQKGAFNCIGWTVEIHPYTTSFWLEMFFQYCYEGQNLGNALDLTNDHAAEQDTEFWWMTMVNTYTGSSRLWATYIG